jgi:hypothetical protein
MIVIKVRCFLFSLPFVDIGGFSLKYVLHVMVVQNVRLTIMGVVITDMKNN